MSLAFDLQHEGHIWASSGSWWLASCDLCLSLKVGGAVTSHSSFGPGCQPTDFRRTSLVLIERLGVKSKLSRLLGKPTQASSVGPIDFPEPDLAPTGEPRGEVQPQSTSIFRLALHPTASMPENHENRASILGGKVL